jgi:O-antigen/teichoic acid export membrane protein
MTQEQPLSPVGLSLTSRLSFLLKDSVLYGGAAAISKAFALITFPLLARHFSTADYGTVDFYLTLAGFLATLFIFGQDSAVARFFYEHSGDSERRQLISQSLCLQMAGLLLLLPILWFAGEKVTALLVEAPQSETLLRIVLLQLPFTLIINFSVNLLKWTFARAQFLLMSLGATAVQAALLVLVIVWGDASIQDVLLVALGNSALFAALGLYFIRRWLVRPQNMGYMREMLPFAIPLGLICVAGSFSPVIERALTGRILGGEALGLYAAGTKVAALLGLFVGAFQTAWGPFSLSLYKAADSAETYNWVLRIFATASCCMVLLLTAIASPLLHVLASPRYADAAIIVLPLALGLAIQATSWITEIGIGISKRSHLHLYPYAAALAATIVPVAILSPQLGISGVALGVLTGHIVRALLATWLAQAAFPLPWKLRSTCVVFLWTAIIGIVAAIAGQTWGLPSQTSVLAIGAGLLLLVSWRVVLSEPERARIVVIARRMRRRAGSVA